MSYANIKQSKVKSILVKLLALAALTVVTTPSYAGFYEYPKTDLDIKVTNSSARTIKVYLKYITHVGQRADEGWEFWDETSHTYGGTSGSTKTYSDITIYGLQMKMRAKILWNWESGRIYYEKYNANVYDIYSMEDLLPSFHFKESSTSWVKNFIDIEALTAGKACYYVYEVGKVNMFHRKC